MPHNTHTAPIVTVICLTLYFHIPYPPLYKVPVQQLYSNTPQHRSVPTQSKVTSQSLRTPCRRMASHMPKPSHLAPANHWLGGGVGAVVRPFSLFFFDLKASRLLLTGYKRLQYSSYVGGITVATRASYSSVMIILVRKVFLTYLS